MRVDTLLIPALLDKSVEYHTRKGLRDWCDCDYCYTKRNGTRSIYHVGTYCHYDQGFLPDRQYDGRQMHAYVTARRNDEIEKLRKKLNEKKQEL